MRLLKTRTLAYLMTNPDGAGTVQLSSLKSLAGEAGTSESQSSHRFLIVTTQQPSQVVLAAIRRFEQRPGLTLLPKRYYFRKREDVCLSLRFFEGDSMRLGFA